MIERDNDNLPDRSGIYEQYIGHASPNKDDIERWKRVERERLAAPSSLAYILREMVRDREQSVLVGVAAISGLVIFSTSC